MPMGKGTYGSKVGRPKKKSMLTASKRLCGGIEEKDYEVKDG